MEEEIKEQNVIAKYDLEERFKFHPSDQEQIEKYDLIRRIAHSFAIQLNEMCPDGREKSLALTKLEEVVFWANASIARTLNDR